MSSLFFCSPKITQPRPQVFSVNSLIICSGLQFGHHWFNSLQWAALLTSFWGHWFNYLQWAALLMSLVLSMTKFFPTLIWLTAAGYGELSMWIEPIRNWEIFSMNNNKNEVLPCTQCITIQCNTVHCTAIQYSAVCNVMHCNAIQNIKYCSVLRSGQFSEKR